MSRLERTIAVARGDEPADLVVSGGRVLSVFTREWLDADVAIADGWIAGVGEYVGREVVDASPFVHDVSTRREYCHSRISEPPMQIR